jgi:hypothetical protein
MSAEFSTSGFKELFKEMDELAEEIGKGKTDKIWRTALTYAMQSVLQDAKAFAPYDPESKTGHLRDHIYMKVHRPMARDKAGQYYAGEMYMARVTASPIRDDTRVDFIVNKRNKIQTVYRNKKPVAVSMEFGNAKVGGGKPFLRPALDYNIDRVTNSLGWSIWQQIQAKYPRKQ